MRRDIGAYTLVELLVSIGIVAVLLSLLVPALAGARGMAHAGVCLSNLRQISGAWAMYTNDYERFPWGDGDYSMRFGWGGVHWYGLDERGNPILPEEEPAQNLLTKRRPVNPYLGRGVTTEAFARIFRCPADTGVRIPAAAEFGIDPDPWGDFGVGNASGEGDLTVFGQLGTSYEANDVMYSADGKGHGEHGPRHGPKDVYVSYADFVIVGDAGAMRTAESGLHQEVYVQGWWHGFGRGHLAMLDGSARSERVIGESLGYTFHRLP